MTKAEFARAFTLASDRSVSLADVNDSHLHGCAMPGFEPVTTTLAPVAKMIRWQCSMFNGQWDHAELDELRKIARYRFDLIGAGSDAESAKAERAASAFDILENLCR